MSQFQRMDWKDISGYYFRILFFIILYYFMRKSTFFRGSIAVFAVTLLTACSQATPPQQPAEQVVKDGIKKLASVTSDSFEFTANADLKVKGEAGGADQTGKINLSFSGAKDFAKAEEAKMNLKVDASGSAEGEAGSASAQLLMDKDTLYVNLAKLEGPGLPVTPEQLAQFTNKWWRYPLPAGTSLELAQMMKMGTSDNTQEMTSEMKQMKDFMEKTNFVENPTYVGAESIKGEQSYHYRGKLSKAAVKEFFMKVAEINGTTVTDAKKQDMEAQLAGIDVDMDVWVGKDSGIATQFEANVHLNNFGDGVSGTIKLHATAWDFNKPITIQVPANVSDFPISPAMMEGMSGDAMGM